MVMDAMAGGVRPAFELGGLYFVTRPMMSMYMPMSRDPMSKEPLRPILSTRKSRKNRHATTLQRPKKPERRRASLPAPTAAKICGETGNMSVVS
jgi:hypothetical protein